MNHRFQDQTLRVHQDMALSAFHLLSSVVTSPIPSHTGALDRLAIHNARAGLRISLEAYSQTMAQGSVQPLPGTLDAPSSEVVVNGLPRWKLMRQQAPSTTTSDDVVDSIKDLAQGVHPGPSGGFWSR